MDRKIAERLQSVAFECTRLLDESVVMVQKEAPDDLKAYRLGVGWVFSEIGDRLLAPIYKEHPDLAPEFLRRKPYSARGLDKDLAAQIMTRAETCLTLLSEIDQILHPGSGEPEEGMVRLAAGALVLEIQQRITDPILREHPDLLPEGEDYDPGPGPTLGKVAEMAGFPKPSE